MRPGQRIELEFIAGPKYRCLLLAFWWLFLRDIELES